MAFHRDSPKRANLSRSRHDQTTAVCPTELGTLAFESSIFVLSLGIAVRALVSQRPRISKHPEIRSIRLCQEDAVHLWMRTVVALKRLCRRSAPQNALCVGSVYSKCLAVFVSNIMKAKEEHFGLSQDFQPFNPSRKGWRATNTYTDKILQPGNHPHGTCSHCSHCCPNEPSCVSFDLRLKMDLTGDGTLGLPSHPTASAGHECVVD